MARLIKKSILGNISGAIGKQIVIKHYRDGVVISSFPVMSKKKPTPLQKKSRSLFAKAVAYAVSISRNPLKKKEYAKKIGKGKSVYQEALKEYLKKNK